MAARAGAAGARKQMRKVAEKIDHGNKMFTHIPAQMAQPGPPLGSQLGQVGINIAAFVKDFNLRTSIYKEGVPIPCFVTVNADRSYNLNMDHPPWPYFIMQVRAIPHYVGHYAMISGGRRAQGCHGL